MEVLGILKSSILDISQFVVSHPVYAALGAGIGCIVLTQSYVRLTCGVCDCDNSLEGKTIIITGCNAGIGKETARELAKHGAQIIMACRNPERGQQAVAEIVKSTGNKHVVFQQLDLSSFASVREFVKNFLKTEKKLDILINNAGIYGSRNRVMTVDGCEEVIQSNHLGHFLLTNLLLDLLKKDAPSRIINLSSGAYPRGNKDWNDMHSSVTYHSFEAYAKSKIANVLFTRELANKLEGTGVTANCVHPGLVKTGILKSFTRSEIIVKILFIFFGKTPLEGAQTTVHLACSEEVEKVTGKYFVDCKEQQLEDVALDDDSAKALWLMSERIVGL